MTCLYFIIVCIYCVIVAYSTLTPIRQSSQKNTQNKLNIGNFITTSTGHAGYIIAVHETSVVIKQADGFIVEVLINTIQDMRDAA